MAQYGLLIDYEYCTNCHSCEVACEEAHDFPPQARGIRVFEDGPWQYGEGDDEKWNWNYIPVPSDRCALCAERVTKGQEPACVHHCLAQVMKFGRIDDLAFDENGGRLQSVILRGRAHCFGLLGCDDDLILPWESIRSIGTDVVMVDADPLPGKHRR